MTHLSISNLWARLVSHSSALGSDDIPSSKSRQFRLLYVSHRDFIPKIVSVFYHLRGFILQDHVWVHEYELVLINVLCLKR